LYAQITLWKSHGRNILCWAFLCQWWWGCWCEMPIDHEMHYLLQ
jgi:hypothetical protein